MKFFEFSQTIAPPVPGLLLRALFMRELISMFTLIRESGWETQKDPAEFPSRTTLNFMYSRNTGCTNKFANTVSNPFILVGTATPSMDSLKTLKLPQTHSVL